MTQNTNNSMPALPDPLLSEDYKSSFLKFFNGDSLEHALSELDLLRETLITENYGDLERNDKWLMIDFLRRIGTLINTAHCIFQVIQNHDRVRSES